MKHQRLSRRTRLKIKRHITWKPPFNSALFRSSGSSQLYEKLKNQIHWYWIRVYLDKLYRKYKKFSPDSNFIKEFGNQPRQRWWEMYLFNLFLKNHFKMAKAKSHGPDICFVHNNVIHWCEAVAIQAEERNIRPGEMEFIYGDDGSLITKITGAFSNKSNIIGRYIQNGVISPDEPVIVGINAGSVPDSDLAEDFSAPIITQALLGVGPLTMQIEVFDELGSFIKNGKRKVTRPYRAAVKKMSTGSMIPTTSFLSSGHEHISAVIYSYKRPIDMPYGNEIIILLNPFAKNKISPELLSNFMVYYESSGRLALNDKARARVKEKYFKSSSKEADP